MSANLKYFMDTDYKATDSETLKVNNAVISLLIQFIDVDSPFLMLYVHLQYTALKVIEYQIVKCIKGLTEN